MTFVVQEILYAEFGNFLNLLTDLSPDLRNFEILNMEVYLCQAPRGGYKFNTMTVNKVKSL